MVPAGDKPPPYRSTEPVRRRRTSIMNSSRYRTTLHRGGTGEAAEGLVRRVVGGEEAFDSELVERDVVRRAEAGQRGEEAEANIFAATEFDGEERGRRRVEIERPPLAGNVRIGEQLVEEAAGLVVAGAEQIAVEPLDEGET